MENATTAILIAGGILLGILCITILVYAFTSLSTLGNAAAEKEDARRLAEWNAEWEAYNKTVLYGADIITVINKAKEYKDSIYKVEIEVTDTSGNTIQDRDINAESIYKCTNTEYENTSGRISKIEFQRVQER